MAIRKIDKDTEIEIKNNTRGSFFFSTRSGELVIDLNEYGDSDRISFGELTKISGRIRKILSHLDIVITEVISDDNTTIEEVVTALKIQDSYNELLSLGDTKLSDVDFIDIGIVEEFIQNGDSDKMRKILESKKTNLRYVIAETATELYKRNELSDYNKMKIIAEVLGYKNTDYFWGEIAQEK